ncbi:ABC transporter ATP-binding protein [Mesobacillus harenae]|uniref:ABC transporter ATP-binding protein n=1 Tax=Mesobacillus harenae TaxID=2213203 RepID=UPI001580F315|nr:ABC transporter ATP-binding protein [Mesobacillus harenae]
MSIIKVDNLVKSFGDIKVIKNLSFMLEQGKCIALLGPNGAGKTTTLRMLSGLMKPSSGDISFSGIRAGTDIRSFIGYLPQHPVFYEWMSGEEFLVYVGQLARLSKKESKKRADELLELVGISESKKRRIGKYSGGMKQRLGIAQAIIHRPKMIMLDEPVSALDPFGRREVLQLLDNLKQETTVLFSTHILNDAEEICDEILFLHDGEIVESGTMEQLNSRHTQSKMEVVFKEPAKKFLSEFAQMPAIETFSFEGNKASFVVKDLDIVKKTLLKEAVQKDWPLVKFEISRTTLEDIFMKVVKK